MKEYTVVPFYTGCKGSLDEDKLQQTLNEYANQGWELKKTIHESHNAGFLRGQRDAYFLIFERNPDRNRR